MNKLGTKLGAIAMSAVMAVSFAPSAVITTLAAGSDSTPLDAGEKSIPVYSVFNPGTGEHLFTTFPAEVAMLETLGWTGETPVRWYAPTTGDIVYRLARADGGDHFYTANAEEKDILVKDYGWTVDKNSFCTAASDDEKATYVYRLFKNGDGHHYTISSEEAGILVQDYGWTLEVGDGFYGYAEDQDSPVADELKVTLSDSTPKVGDILTAEVTPDQLVTYQWFADKTEIPDADGATLAVTEDMVGKKLSVKVTSLTGEVATSDATAAVEKTLPELVNVKQETSKQISLKFDGNASVIDADDILVATADEGLVNSVEKVEFLTEGDSTRLLATLSSPLLDGTDYDVTVGAVTLTLSASVGEVVSVMIDTYEAEVNKPTKIEYRLLDEKGVDVTDTVNLKETVLAEITGAYKAAKTSDPTDLSVTMGAVDDKCEVTITYNKGTGSEEGISKAQEITCVGPTANKGTIKYCIPTEVNQNSKCAKFYLEGVGTADLVTIAEGKDTTKGNGVHFAAFDDNGAAIEYDQYEVESANEAIVGAQVRDGFTSGKFAVIDLIGNRVGATQVKVIATSNTASKTYFINVTVKAEKDMVKLKLSDTKKQQLSNAWDEAYTDTIKATIIDDNDADADYFEKIEWKLLNADNYKSATSAPDDYKGLFGYTAGGAPVDDLDPNVVVKAWGAKGGTYTVQATADIADFTKTQTLNVRVTELTNQAWLGGPGVKMTYQYDIDSASMSNIGDTNTIKLAAYANGSTFAGYVRQQDVTKAPNGGAAGAILGGGWVADQTNRADLNDRFYTVEPTVVATSATGAAIQGAVGLAKVRTDVKAATKLNDLYTTIYVMNNAGDVVDEYSLTRIGYNPFKNIVVDANGDAKDVNAAGLYWKAEKDEAMGKGEITIGWKDWNTNEKCDANALSADPRDYEGTAQANLNTSIEDGSLIWSLQFGVKKVATGQLFGFINNTVDPEESFYVDGITAISDKAKAGALAVEGRDYLTWVEPDPNSSDKYDADIARAGKYDVLLTYVASKDFKTQTTKNQFTVTDGVSKYKPAVTLTTKTVDSYTYESFKDVMELNVDLNNNNGLSESLVEPGLITRWANSALVDCPAGNWTMVNSSDKYAKYAIVEDTVGGVPVYFFVSMGATITED